MKPAVVMDTNVAIVANGKADQVSPDCVLTCLKRLRKIQDAERLLLDETGCILDEYRGHLNPSGQPRAGDAFFKWLWNNQGNPEVCQFVRITPDPARVFEEFPESDALNNFDRNDRKFVAVAVASGKGPPILNASDRDWWDDRLSLECCGVRVEFLCPELMEDR